ncbi:hypothetical protein CPB84DRAFT_1779443 [Gymnopilus junonius]|uniref:Glycoside hydrolase subgroup catalytic core protein n=1 Tax=Gymnopilus junonius TaxID=109634 RepID=A0A9P5NKD9_GYMJU|nr:hypothetical protein CPB84DRAFT_1779443 [Gymnopilus junonius]
MQALLVLGYLALRASAQTWCGKNYMATSPIVPPGGLFPIPATSKDTLLALRCAPAIRPYLAEDAKTSSNDVAILIDTPVTFSQIANALPISLSHFNALAQTSLSVTVSTNGKTLVTGKVPLNASRHELPFKLSALEPRIQAYDLSCTATLESQKFDATGSLSFLPDPPADIGSVTKMDLRTGAVLARPADGKGGPFAPVFPIGFYTGFDNYLAQDPTGIPAQLKAQGLTVVHPIPTFDNLTALELVLDGLQEAGLYLMYDMRFTYMNATAVTEEVNRIKSRPNLLVWYTGDEPDGTSDPLDATLKSSNLIQSLDGGDGQGGAGYHPVSLVLNCEDYFYTQYASGADIIMQDTYMIGNNVTFSSQWGTPCTPDYGDCGCDNCKGNFQDISTRMDEFRERNFINGWELNKAVWTVPQGFGNDTYWKRFPTGQEWVVQSVVGINHGGLGVVSWDDPSTSDIQSSASTLAGSLVKMTPFILSPAATFRQITINLIDVGLWTVGKQTLVLATNTNYFATSVSLKELGLQSLQPFATQVLDTGAKLDSLRGKITLESVGSGGFIVNA